MGFIKKKTSFLVAISIALFFGCTFSSIVQAENKLDKKGIYLNQGGTANNSIFNDEMPISPGDKLVKEFYIYNNNKFGVSVNSISIEGNLLDSNGKIIDKSKAEYNDFLNNSFISFFSEDKEVFKGTLGEFLSLDLSSDKAIKIDKSALKNCTIEYKLSEAAGNSVMGMMYKFDVTFGYSEAADIVKTGQRIDFKTLILIGTFLLNIGLSQLFRKNIFSVKST